MPDQSVSLNKFISSTGICSRREADKWIEAGRVMINDQVARKGNRVEAGDSVTLDGKRIGNKPEPVYILFNKPPGITCTTDQSDPSNIIDYIKFPQRIFPIGRLDKNSTGLILLTNNGDIVNKILRKEEQHEKEYVVTTDRTITRGFLRTMSAPIPMLGTKTDPCKVVRVKDRVFKITLTQGLNRQIRRMCEYCGYQAISLKRIRIMHLRLDDLPSGKWRFLTESELGILLNKINYHPNEK